MQLGRGRIVGGVLVATVLAGGAVAVWQPWDGPGHGLGHQSAEEIADLASLPDGLTPLDPTVPSPTGDDPTVVGTPPEITAAATPEEFLARAEELRDAGGVGAGEDGPAAKGPVPGLPGDTDPGSSPGAPEAESHQDDDSLLVTFADGTSSDVMAAALEAAGVTGTPIAGTTVAEVATGGAGGPAAVAAALDDVDAVESVDPNLVRSATREPNDPEYAGQAPPYGTVHLPQAWDVADTRANVTVAVLDTGVDLDHPDLVPNLVAGFDVVNGDTSPADDNGHGTQVAGIIGAATGNGGGVAGVAWNARIMPVKVLDAQGQGTDADIAEGIVWATDHGARVINMSLAGPGTSTLIDQAVAYAIAHEVVLVAAAGNDASMLLTYPAAAPGVYGVTATDANGKFAWFSNHGPWYYLSAPGIGIRTTALAAGPDAAYDNGTGTSFAAPIVAGVMALVRERHPGWGWFEVGDEVLRTARDAGLAGLDDAYGFGLLDASAALGVSPIAPVSQPVRTGDVPDLQSAARLVTVGATTTETIGHEYDEDWFAFDVPAGAEVAATITVTPPPLSPTDRAQEMDPSFWLYGPGGGLITITDEHFFGEAEQVRINLGPGRHTLRIRNWAASASPGTYSLRVTLGTSLPPTAWAPAARVFEGGFQSAVAVADYDGDGRDDVAMATGRDGDPVNDLKIFVFTQTATGAFGRPQIFDTSVPDDTHSASSDPLRAVDLDADGDVDLVRGTDGGLDVALNDGHGLTAPEPHPGGTVTGIQTADLDGSGPDELVVRRSTGLLDVLRWTDGDFVVSSTGISAPAAAPEVGIPYDVAELTGDGRPDIVVFAGDDARIHAREASGGWAPATSLDLVGFDGRTFERTVVAGDISGDGRADIVVVGEPAGQLARLVYRLQQPGGTFGPTVSLATGESAGGVRIADLNADGRNDLAVAHHSGRIGVHLQTPAGSLGSEQDLGGPFASFRHSPDSIAVGDLDTDGANDLAVPGYTDRGLYIFRHQAAAPAEGEGPWIAGSVPAEHATGVAPSVRPTVTFGRDVDPWSVVEGETVWLVDGRNARIVDATVSLSGRTMTVRPSAPLSAGAPYQVWISGVTSGNGAQSAYGRIPFTVAAGAAPSYSVNGTYVPFRVDLDGNGYDDVFWYGPGAAGDSVWFFGPDGRTSVTAGVSGAYTPVAGDFDGNGYEDIFWYGPGSATDAMWRNGRSGIVSVAMPVSGVYVPVAGDFDGNGYDDILWYGPGAVGDSVWSFGPNNGRTTTASG